MSEGVLQALHALYTDPSAAAKEQANQWLQNFQKEPEAWETANLILASPDAPPETKMFAAQTFRTKITYDLDQLPQEQRLPLKDTLIANLKTTPKASRTQLCLALADLLLQLPEWQNPTQEVIQHLGNDPATVLALLEFLHVLPQEMTGNIRINITSHDWRTDETATQILSLVETYYNAQGVTNSIRQLTFQVLRAWLQAGELLPSAFQTSSFFQHSFTALTSDELFDDAIDLLCDLIHETQELGDNLAVIEAIVPRLVALRPHLTKAAQEEDTDRVRGYCRLFVEAGEWYAQLMLQHPTQFLPIVEAIADCSAYSELEVVSITLNFWWKLAVGLKKGGFIDDPSCQPFVQTIARLVDIVIGHLRYPQDPDQLTGQDKDDFREFRHSIGDTLKDCCSVLGATACLSRSFSIIETEMASGGRWEYIEAALFSMRAMGAQVDLQENQVMPRIFAIIPQLPQSPSKIRYAATLVVARYTEWLSVHPELIPPMLEYTLAGFQVDKDEVAVASASALKYICKDCSEHLVSYLPPLFEFTQQYGAKLHQDDLLEITSGFAHIMSTMPPTEAIPALQTFCMPLMEQVHTLAAKAGAPATKAELQTAGDAMERLCVYLGSNSHLSDHLPQQCSSTASEAWAMFDGLLTHYGNSASLAERACSALRRGLSFFGKLALPLAPAILDRMTANFEATGISGYIWIAGRTTDLLRLVDTSSGDAQIQTQIQNHLDGALQKMTNKLVALISASNPAESQDSIEDYLHFVRNVAEVMPDLLFLSPAFNNAVQIAISATTLLNPSVCRDGLDTLRTIIGHDALPSQLQPASNPINVNGGGGESSKSGNWSAYASSIRNVIAQPTFGGRLVQILLTRLVTDFHEDCSPMSITLGRMLADKFPQEMSQWVPAAIAQIPPKDLREAERESFGRSFMTALSSGNLNGVRQAWVQLDRASRKERERASSRKTV